MGLTWGLFPPPPDICGLWVQRKKWALSQSGMAPKKQQQHLKQLALKITGLIYLFVIWVCFFLRHTGLCIIFLTRCSGITNGHYFNSWSVATYIKKSELCDFYLYALAFRLYVKKNTHLCISIACLLGSIYRCRYVLASVMNRLLYPDLIIILHLDLIILWIKGDYYNIIFWDPLLSEGM